MGDLLILLIFIALVCPTLTPVPVVFDIISLFLLIFLILTYSNNASDNLPECDVNLGIKIYYLLISLLV